jgi:hypothetical protein
VVVVKGAVGHMHAAEFASWQRDGTLLMDTDAVLGVALVEMLVHAIRSPGGARAVRDWAEDILLVPGESSWDISVEEGWRGVRRQRWEGRHTNAMLHLAMSREGGKLKHISTFGTGHPAVEAFMVAVAFTSHSSLVGSVGHASGFDCRQANHQLHLGVVGLEADAFR